MKCMNCKGACCEEFAVPMSDVRVPWADAQRWLELHGIETADGYLRFECRCRMLDAWGLCSIYSDRPMTCIAYAPGDVDCLETVRRRRTADEYELIREPGDPVVESLYGPATR